jgi:hypothetical protein
MRAVVRVARQPLVAVLLIVVFLYGAGVPMPPLPVVLVAALAIAWALGKRTPRKIEDDD